MFSYRLVKAPRGNRFQYARPIRIWITRILEASFFTGTPTDRKALSKFCESIKFTFTFDTRFKAKLFAQDDDVNGPIRNDQSFADCDTGSVARQTFA